MDKYYPSSPTKRERKIIIKRENSNKQIFHLSLIKEKESHGQKLRFIPHQKERKRIIKRENSTKQILHSVPTKRKRKKKKNHKIDNEQRNMDFYAKQLSLVPCFIKENREIKLCFHTHI